MFDEQPDGDPHGECAAEIKRLESCLKWEQNWASRIGTHGPGCYAWGPSHFECAIERIKELEAERDAMLAKARNAALNEAAQACDDLHHTWRWDDEPDSASGPRDCAAAIRKLKSTKEST